MCSRLEPGTHSKSADRQLKAVFGVENRECLLNHWKIDYLFATRGQQLPGSKASSFVLILVLFVVVVVVVKTFQESSHELTGALRSSQELSGALRNSQELSGALRSSQEVSGALRSSPELSGALEKPG